MYILFLDYGKTTSPYGKRNVGQEKLGKISMENYNANKEIIDKLMSKRKKEELKEYLKQY